MTTGGRCGGRRLRGGQGRWQASVWRLGIRDGSANNGEEASASAELERGSTKVRHTNGRGLLCHPLSVVVRSFLRCRRARLCQRQAWLRRSAGWPDGWARSPGPRPLSICQLVYFWRVVFAGVVPSLSGGAVLTWFDSLRRAHFLTARHWTRGARVAQGPTPRAGRRCAIGVVCSRARAPFRRVVAHLACVLVGRPAARTDGAS